MAPLVIEQTVVVVGAGASHYLGFPLGRDLVTKLRSPLAQLCPNIILDPAAEGEVERSRLEFVQRLGNALFGSIDEFLASSSPEVRDAGATSIAAALLSAQINAARNDPVKDGWHTKLYQRCVTEHAFWHPKQNVHRHMVRVITFNYDLAIELALCRLLWGNNVIPNLPDAWKHACSLPILHVHGQLGFGELLPELVQNNGYSPRLQYGEVADMGRSLRFAYDRLSEQESEASNKVWSVAARWIQEAQRVVFVGFAFNPLNLAKLGLSPLHAGQVLGGKRIFSTWVDPDTKLKNAAIEALGAGINFLDCIPGPLGTAVDKLVFGEQGL